MPAIAVIGPASRSLLEEPAATLEDAAERRSKYVCIDYLPRGGSFFTSYIVLLLAHSLGTPQLIR